MSKDKESLTELETEFLQDILAEAEVLSFTISDEKGISIVEWAQRIVLGTKPFQIKNHEYEVELLTNNFPRQVYKKGAQMGLTEVNVFKTIHGLIFSRYPQGVLYLFPSALEVSDFSKGRFQTLIRDNPRLVGTFVSDTDAVGIKRVRKAMLYCRGARSVSKIEGIKKSSSQLKSVPVDRVVYDEVDEMEPAMIDLAHERISHSEIKEEAFLSTPSIPDYGIDKLYQESDQRVWEIKCNHCGKGTVLELEFPNCLIETAAGKVIRVCKKCKQEIYPRDGEWIAQRSEVKDTVGWWISQLNSVYVDPGDILKAFNDPPHGNVTEFYNSKLGMAHVTSENRLNVGDVYLCCGQDVMRNREPSGPCAMGVDVGRLLHVVVGYKPREKQLEILYMGRVSNFDDLHAIARNFNVRSAIIDIEPETRKARSWQESENFEIFLCDYVHTTKGIQFDESTGIVRVSRIEICDTTHELFTETGRLVIPRRCEEVDIFANQVTSLVKILEEDPETGSRGYKYRKTGEDHYRHALNYFYLASQRIGLSHDSRDRRREPLETITDFDVFGK